MNLTLLEAIKKRDVKRSFDYIMLGYYIYYISLPKGVKQLSFFRYFLFVKEWKIVFERNLDFEKLDAICKKKNYSISSEKVNKPTHLEGVAVIFENNRMARNSGIFEPDIRYYVHNGKKLLF